MNMSLCKGASCAMFMFMGVGVSACCVLLQLRIAGDISWG